MRQASWRTPVLILGLGAVILCWNSSAQAQSGDAILDLLIKKGLINQRETNDAREQLNKDTATAVELHSKAKASSWLAPELTAIAAVCDRRVALMPGVSALIERRYSYLANPRITGSL